MAGSEGCLVSLALLHMEGTWMIEVIRKLMLQVHLHFAQVAVAAVDLRG